MGGGRWEPGGGSLKVGCGFPGNWRRCCRVPGVFHVLPGRLMPTQNPPRSSHSLLVFSIHHQFSPSFLLLNLILLFCSVYQNPGALFIFGMIMSAFFLLSFSGLLFNGWLWLLEGTPPSCKGINAWVTDLHLDGLFWAPLQLLLRVADQ